MTADVVDRTIEQLSSRVEAARADQSRKEAAAEHARGEHEKALARLRELGCETVEEADAEVARIEAELLAEVERIRAALAEAEGVAAGEES